MGRKWTDLEGPIHQAVLHYLHLALPGAIIHHSPNETSLKGPAVARMIAKQKNMGMRPGFPDLLVMWRGFTWGFEVKAGKGGRLSDAQKDMQKAFQTNGFQYAVVRSVDDARDCVEGWRATDHSKFHPVPFAADVPFKGTIS